ncbi:TetR/AcrR family transcriptional regulator [Acidocella aminolytica]|jgi:TetR/AcrR family transcriptional repressor of nem operon|uniref:Transcriptional regulator TetR n=1 Tax=Acidocella aminolytica 101 = DSM 11237 TaxID=1120923 RepID=A0A0D6PIQ6_9PROT|nr:TetR/AcrR family transcriptional regulator [Acidocella aminolytica]GAN81562.1 transcriptional regulator TetR [Acidocella aminolytica 101 = DSM 11237]GBQ36004.1 transcriptional regulator [Acidocella aminolytica 101 = DSM 11237]SHF47971.1 transcriptional regulator, TetR family [Acidocella aminolytica 101 = DSM 11237]
MRFEKGHKEQTRRRIIETASHKFRKDGVAATGIAGLMADAGLTHGGFYAHFASKEELVRAALEEALSQNYASRQEVLDQAQGADSLEALVRFYLRPAHRDTPERGCAAAALVSEIARHEPETRAAFTTRLRRLLDQIASLLPPEMNAEARDSLAIGLFGTLLGCLQMARAVNDPALSTQILESGEQAALNLARTWSAERRGGGISNKSLI